MTYSRVLPLLSLLISTLPLAAAIDPPELKEAGLKIELIAAEPDLVTPIGCAVDKTGRVFVLESHTHFPPKNYDGPKSDRIKVWSDSDGDGRVDKFTIFADGFVKGMNLRFAPDGSLYVTQRDAVFRLRDLDGDGRAETRETILKLETAGDYPHNGLNGITFGPDGMLYIGMGENLGAAYTLHGADGSQEQGGGEGGNIFRCTPDGKTLERWATGFWNVFALDFTAAGQLFMVDNDPDSRPPCRLVHVIRGGDYGYKFRYGRKGTHPFIAWNGELPGTLPMVAGTGEAPSGLMEASKARLTSAFDGAMLVASTWEHTIERFRLVPRGSSWEAKREIIAVGGADFRPVALAPAPDGSVYITDWVKSDYSVHKHGRLWRLSAEHPMEVKPVALTDDAKRLMALEAAPHLDSAATVTRDALASSDPFLQTAAAANLARNGDLPTFEKSSTPRVRLSTLMALRRAPPSPEKVTALLREALADDDENVRLFAGKWAGEEVIAALLPELRKLDGQKLSGSIGQVASAAFDVVRGSPDVSPLERRPAKNEFTIIPLTKAEDENDWLFLSLAQDSTRPANLRADLLGRLGTLEMGTATKLLPLLNDPDISIRRETVRMLRGSEVDPSVKAALEKALVQAKANNAAALAEQIGWVLGVKALLPASDEDWRKILDEAPGDAASGRRLFVQPAAMCAQCHTAEGRGAGLVGPDLSTIARTADREKLLQSLIHPSRDIAPQFATMSVETRAHGTQMGRLAMRHADGAVTLVSPANTGIFIPADDIVSMRPQPISMMPEGLPLAMTRADFRDLMAYLLSLK
jgi:putative membrane-bound dehydrogenase-like protein